MLTYKEYMLEKHINNPTSIGTFTKDLKEDKEFPCIYSKKEGLLYLNNYGAESLALNAFKRSWKEYKKYRLKEISKIKPIRRYAKN